MTKIIRSLSLLLAAAVTMALVGCGDGEKAGIHVPVATDNAVMGMSYTPPAAYETVNRNVEQTSDGKLVQKNMIYKINDNSTLTYAFADSQGQNIEDLLSGENVETKEYNGQKFYLRCSGKTCMAFAQDGDRIYGIQYKAEDEEKASEEFDIILGGVKFIKTDSTVLNDFTLDDIKYEISPDAAVYSVTTSIEEKPDGTVVSKIIMWNYGKDEDNLDYRFAIRLYKNTQLKDKLNEEKEYTEKQIGDVIYTVLKTEDEDSLYSYLVQHGEDVYEIYNAGTNGGWFVSRSDESKKAFKEFLATVHF